MIVNARCYVVVIVNLISIAYSMCGHCNLFISNLLRVHSENTQILLKLSSFLAFAFYFKDG